MRHKGLATTLLEAIESDARDYFHADYLCCDSIADKFYKKNGYRLAQESRLWKKI
jgi:Acetyltransferase (GNAT) family.